jgi:O-antigen/teichoic acid export membrane protein
MTLCLFLFAPWLAEHTLNAPRLAGALRVSALALFISALNGAQIGALSGFEAFRTIARVSLFAGLLSLPILVGGAYVAGLDGAVWAMVVNLAVSWLLNHLALRGQTRIHKVPFAFRDSLREWPVLWLFSLPAALSGAIVGPTVWICNSILVNQDGGYAALGIYLIAFQVSMIITMVNAMIGQAFLPICVSKFNSNSTAFEFVNIVLPWLIGVFAALPFLCVPELWAVLAGQDYAGEGMVRTVVLVAVSAILVAHRQGVARNFVAGSYLWWGFLSNSFWAVVAVTCAFCLRHLGAEGLAASFAIAYVVNTLVFVPLYIRLRLCPKYLLLSRYSLLIWGILIFLAAMAPLLDLSLPFRCAVLLPSYLIIIVLFRRLWYSRRDETEGLQTCGTA